MTKTLATKHEPYSLDLLNYEMQVSLAEKLMTPPFNRFSGKRIRQNSAKVKAMLKRDRRLRKKGYSITLFAS